MLMYLLPVFSQTTRRSSLNPPPKTDMSWDEYLLYDTERSVDITSQLSLLQIQEVFDCWYHAKWPRSEQFSGGGQTVVQNFFGFVFPQWC